MIDWIDIAEIMIAVVLFENMGMKEAVEKVLKYDFKILSCTRCTTFWATLAYFVYNNGKIIDAISFSFINSYIAVWCELLFGYLTVLYDDIYEEISNFAKNLK